MSVYLPPEILNHIFTFAQGSSPTWEEGTRSTARSYDPVYLPHRDPNATLLSASLVSKAWADAAQRVLYRHVIFPTRPRERTYTAWIESDARRRYRTMSLWIRPSRDLVRIFNTLQGVESLELGQPDATVSSWAVLRNPSLKDLKALSLPFPDYFYKNQANIAPLPFSLNSLAYGLFADAEHQTPLLSMLLADSQQTLHTLRIRQYEDITYFLVMNPVPLPNLRHLILEEYSEELTCLGDGLKSFVSLEKLELRGGTPKPASWYWELSDTYFDLTVATLPIPNSLRHLVVGIDNRSGIQGVERTIDHSALEGLEVLEFMSLRRSDVRACDEAALIETCKRRSITLVYADGPVQTAE
ncbi:hypothetical protein RQP46_008595 [Phenoliferia psychrophenolica]